MHNPLGSIRDARVARPCLALLLWAGALAAGCKGEPARQRPFEVCGRNKPCPGGRTCVLSPGLPAGACVLPCKSDQDCQPGQRCTGRYRSLAPRAPIAPSPGPRDSAFSETGPASRAPRTGPGAYCQAATVPLGGDCTGLKDGCQVGLECLHGRICVRSCREDGDCREEERCVPGRDQRVFGSEPPKLHHRCVLSTAKEGAACGPDRRPLCARGHACLRMRCVRQCTKDEDCGDGRVCDGSAPVEGGSAPSVEGAAQEAYRYCRRAAAEGEACGNTPERDIACQKDHRCYRSKCRRGCASDDDCAAGEGRPRRCRSKRRRGRPFKVCL